MHTNTHTHTHRTVESRRAVEEEPVERPGFVSAGRAPGPGRTGSGALDPVSDPPPPPPPLSLPAAHRRLALN